MSSAPNNIRSLQQNVFSDIVNNIRNAVLTHEDTQIFSFCFSSEDRVDLNCFNIFQPLRIFTTIEK